MSDQLFAFAVLAALALSMFLEYARRRFQHNDFAIGLCVLIDIPARVATFVGLVMLASFLRLS